LAIVADNPLGTIGGSKLEITMPGGQPAIDDFRNLHPEVADLDKARGFFTAITRVAFHLNLHGLLVGIEALGDALRL
jgi:hypothetical protein